MNSIRRIWRRSKLKTKLMLIYCFLILVAMTSLTVFTFSVFSNSLREKILYSAGHSISQTRDFLDYKFSGILRGLSQVANDALIRDILSVQEESNIMTEYWNMLDMKERLVAYHNSDEISHVRLYVDDKILAAKDKIHIFGIADVKEERWMQRLQEEKHDVYSFSHEDLGSSDGIPTLAFAEKIKSTVDYNQVIGYVRVDINRYDIEEILLKADATKESVTYLVNEEDQVVASSGKGDYLLPQVHQEEVKKNYLEGDNHLREVKDGENRYLIAEKYLYYPGWTMVTVIPYQGMMQEVHASQMRYLVAAMAVFVLVGILLYVTANSVTRRVERLASRMQLVQQGSLDVTAGDGGEDEIGSLYKNFDYMILKTQGLLSEKYELGKLAKTAELKALQSQINPHFLYNTLDMIKWFSHSGMNEEIDTVVTELAKFYKMTLNRGKEIVTVAEEVTHSQAYVTIQNYRFDGTIRMEVDIPEDIMDCPIPKITLQPLIENSILHGILEKDEEEGRIFLTGEKKGDEVILYLRDDGIGIPSVDMDEILLGQKKSYKGSGFGVRNIHERLKAIYGERAGLVYHSVVLEGTTVEIHLGNPGM